MKLYSQEFGSMMNGRGTLEVVRRKSGTVSIVAYLPAGVSNFPEVLHNGTIETARQNWKRSVEWMTKTCPN